MIKNVGPDHQDLHARLGSSIGITLMLILSMPFIEIDPAKYRIALLYVSLMGCTGLAFGIVFGRKNIAPGMIAMIIPFIVYMIPEPNQKLYGLFIFFITLSYNIFTIIKRKCIINRFLHINSYVE